MPTTVVLVPGAWHGAWAWDRVTPLLTAGAVSSVAVDLPGRGPDGGRLGDLHADSAALATELDRHDSVVLVGHSYGGAVITEAGDHPAVAHLVYVAGFPIRPDESCARAAEAEAEALDPRGRTDLGSGFVPGADGTVTLDPAVAKDCLYNDCDEATAQWALERLGPQRLASLGDSPTRVAWRTRPSTYLVCAADRTVHPDLQRILARRCGATIEWPTGHSPFLSDPKRVADLLVGIVDMVNIAGPDEGA